jgi:hypothetical protein
MHCHTRQRMIALALGLLVTPLGAHAQPPAKVWRLGLFHVGLDHVPPSLDALREGLQALGYEEGKNLLLDWRQPSPKLPLPQCGVNSTLFIRGQLHQQPRHTATG